MSNAATDSTFSMRGRLVWVAAGLAALASLLFAFAIPAHVEDGWEYRGFFVVVAVAEMALALALVAWSWRTEPLSGAELRRAHAVVAYGAAVPAASVLVYSFTLVTGIQHAGHSPEVIAAGPAPLDIITKIVEVALVIVLVRLAMLTSTDEVEPATEA